MKRVLIRIVAFVTMSLLAAILLCNDARADGPAPAAIQRTWSESEIRALFKDEFALAMPQIKQAVKDAIKEALPAAQAVSAPTTIACDSPPVSYSASACGSAGARRELFRRFR